MAALAVGYAVQVNLGNLHPDALLWLSVGLLALVAAVALPALRPLEGRGDAPLAVLLAGGVALQLCLLLATQPGVYMRVGGPAYVLFFRGLAVIGVLTGAALSPEPWLRRAVIPLLIGTALVLGVWMIHASPSPWIDVFVFQRDASLALLRGENPYAITFPDIYGNSLFYGPGMSVNGRLTFGFPYPPLSLLLALPGQLLGGDHRYAQLGAMAGAAALIAYARQGRLGPLAAALLLVTPRGLFVLEQGWTEPFVVLLLAAVVFAACRYPRAVPWVLGLFFAVKQYLVLAVPLVVLLAPRPLTRAVVWGWAWRAGAVGLAVSLPLVLWNPAAFWHSAVSLQFYQPFRIEALSYLAYVVSQGGPQLSSAVALAAAVVAIGLALWRAPRTPTGFAAAVALVLGAFFAFNKQAFCNYYYFVVGAACVAVGASPPNTVGAPSPATAVQVPLSQVG